MFADDLALVAPSRSVIQQMMTICVKYCKQYCLSFNVSKTKAMIFGPQFDKSVASPLFLDGQTVQYVTEWKYLGCLVVAGKNLLFSNRNDIASFRRSANSVVRCLKRPNEQVLMKLLHTFSLPILTYACEVKHFSYSEMHECHVATNDAIRRIFSFNRWESIRRLRESFGYRDIYTIFAQRKRNFLHRFQSTNNTVLHCLSVTT